MKKTTQPKLKPLDDIEEDESVERLKVNTHGVNNDLESLGISEDGEVSIAAKELDYLLVEERLVNDTDLDRLFTEKKKSKYDDVEVEVRKALFVLGK